ncbi:STAS domain-containing protein [Streptomyces inhibens]|uniref:STAS domain-containing protein n=1 Tax=Streptomyces inhibens TaxID=2293571 RepID=UPI002467DD51|nr:STAS domain-containing protein [Streptomyces inhibens]
MRRGGRPDHRPPADGRAAARSGSYAHPRTTVLCDVRALKAPGTTTVEALLRLQLTARRLGHGIRLRHVPEALRTVLTVTGLTEALPVDRARKAPPIPP